jgi:hypothetical protein
VQEARLKAKEEEERRKVEEAAKASTQVLLFIIQSICSFNRFIVCVGDV